MNELLEKLLSSELLTEDNRSELKTALETMISETVELTKKETEEKVRVELTERYIQDRESLVEAVDTKLHEMLSKELDELKEDIENYKDLEVEYANKLNQEKKKLNEQLKTEMKELLENIDEFLDVVLNEELEELRESIEEAKQNKLGMKIFEAFKDTFRSVYVDEDGIQRALDEAKQELESVKNESIKLKEQNEALLHSTKLAEVLEPLSGKTRELMEALIAKKPTDKLQEYYDRYIAKVLSETVTKQPKETPEKEDTKVLAENDKAETKDDNTVLKTGDKEPINKIDESVSTPKNGKNSEYAHIRRLAGLD